MYLTQGLHRAVQRHPDTIALTHVSDAGERHWTFAEVVDAVGRQAAYLQARGIGANDRVALLSPNSDQLIQAILACWWLGAVACPMNTRWSEPELDYALKDSDAALLLHDVSMPAPQGFSPSLSLLDLANASASMPAVADTRTGGSALASLLYTGGTTGRSKGVMLTHANFWSACMTRGAELNNPPDAVSLLVAPLFHVAGLGRMVGQMVVGGRWLTMAQFRTPAVLSAIARFGINDTIVVPSMLQALLDDANFDASKLQCLDRIAFGAAPMPPDLLNRALAAWPNAEFFQAYGLTETAGAVCINLPVNHRGQGEARTLLNSVGRAGLGAEIKVMNDAGEDAPRGQVGEVWVRGPMVMQGYWKQPEATAAAFVDGWFRTGDLGRMREDGYVFIVDRLKDMIITGGENVYCAEVEAVLRNHPDVAQAAVIGVPDVKWGEAVHAVIVLTNTASLSTDDMSAALHAACHQQLAGYKCPRSFSFLTELPMSAAGKILKNVLRERERERARARA
ncbi:CaiC Acyl-CoA synthetases (AMP-forming)/AMP-acid ligases II [Burkholderiaceae bacterium]